MLSKRKRELRSIRERVKIYAEKWGCERAVLMADYSPWGCEELDTTEAT